MRRVVHVAISARLANAAVRGMVPSKEMIFLMVIGVLVFAMRYVAKLITFNFVTWDVIIYHVSYQPFNNPLCCCCCMQDGKSALMEALREFKLEVLSSLLRAGATVDLQDKVSHG